MVTKDITLNGKTYPVVFTMKTIMGFEDIIGHSFFNEKTFSTFKVRIALIIAAIVAADDKVEITFEELGAIDTLEGMNDIVKAFNTVMELSAAFFHLPAVEQQEEKKRKKKGQVSKNV